MTNNSEEKKAEDFLNNTAKEGCFSCENFGKTSCPAFNMAVKNLGVNAQVLKEKIERAQEGREMRACENDSSANDNDHGL